MRQCQTYLGLFFIPALLLGNLSLAAQKVRAAASETDRDDEDLTKIRAELESLKAANQKLAAEIQRLDQKNGASRGERIFVNIAAGGSLGLKNLPGSGFGYATGFEFLVGDWFSGIFRFS